ncbi:unnamed protein product, partial [Durusdinium trenchii]
EQKPRGFYYNAEKGRWMEHGVEETSRCGTVTRNVKPALFEEKDQEDVSEYDPMTGKKITK